MIVTLHLVTVAAFCMLCAAVATATWRLFHGVMLGCCIYRHLFWLYLVQCLLSKDSL